MSGSDLLPATITARQSALLRWYDANRRDLPWRQRPSLYGTWISEVMLQQTTVATVVPFWERFMQRFPDVGALATAELEAVLAAWAGLGYYRRARNLHAAARVVVNEHGGIWPQTAAQWRALPGIGEYAAGAIASIAGGEVVAAVDANASRVICRWNADDPDQAARFTPSDIRRAAQAHVDPSRPGDWNQAVMELGATLCQARQADCPRCPVRRLCRAAGASEPTAIGVAPARPAAIPVVTSTLLLHDAATVLLLPAADSCVARVRWTDPIRDDLTALHAGLYSLPQMPWYPTGDSHGSDFASAWNAWLTASGLADQPVRPVGTVRAAVTRYRLSVSIFAAPLALAPEGGPVAAGALGWRRAPLPGGRSADSGPPVSSITRRCIRRFEPAPKTR